MSEDTTFRNEEILRLWAEGYSLGWIGVKLHCTRSVCAGIVMRARKRGVDVDPHGRHVAYGGRNSKPFVPKVFVQKPLQLKRDHQGRPKSEPKEALIAAPVYRPGEPTGMKGKLIYKLSANGCKFPVGTDKQGRHRFCDKPQKENKPYCEEHCAEAYAPSKASPVSRTIYSWLR